MKELSKITVLYINGFFCQKPLCTMIEIFICPLWQSTIFYSFQIARDFLSQKTSLMPELFCTGTRSLLLVNF